MPERLNNRAILDEILATVRGLKGSETAAIIASKELADEREQAAKELKWYTEHSESCAAAALEAYRLMDESIYLMNNPDANDSKLRREKWATARHEWFMDCREKGVWPEHEDPYYDPNACSCG
jgi:hypothetical protein